MKPVEATKEAFSRWIDLVASATVNLRDWFTPPLRVEVIEDDKGELVLRMGEQIAGAAPSGGRIRMAEGEVVEVEPPDLILSGQRAELMLKPDRFLFQPLELPSRAAEFLDGIVRAQIDRLTPWGHTDAAFGWSKPAQVGTDRIVITIAATALRRVTPYVQALARIGAQSVVVFTSLPDGGCSPVKVLEERGRGVVEIDSVRRTLIGILAASAVGAGVAIGASSIIGAHLERQQDELSARLTTARAAVGADALTSATAARRTIEQRKSNAPSTVIILESLSQLLPDHTYVKELRIEGTKLRLIGITRDAPSLIGLIERSPQFTRATFFAPTTRSTSESGERFHIEAQIQPLVLPRS